MTPADDPFAEFLNNCPKLVVSTTLQSVDWQNATLITNDVIGEVARRKQQPGKDILIPGSATSVRHLVHEGLVDELRSLLFPIVSGVLSLTYQPASE
jgi:dihydrofolate reductase